MYNGYFYEENFHGRGEYTWPDGSSYVGRFYLGKKEGYATFQSGEGDTFVGLYKENERFGPGVLTYAPGGEGEKEEDIGLWHRHYLVRCCSVSTQQFTIGDHPEYFELPPSGGKSLSYRQNSATAQVTFDEVQSVSHRRALDEAFAAGGSAFLVAEDVGDDDVINESSLLVKIQRHVSGS